MLIRIGVFTATILLPWGAAADTQQELAGYRQRIDSLDQRIVTLIQERARAVEQVGAIKRAAHLPIAVPSREAQVIQRVQELAKTGPLPADSVGRIYQTLVQEMRDWEAKEDAAMQPKGPEKTNGNQPCRSVRTPSTP